MLRRCCCASVLALFLSFTACGGSDDTAPDSNTLAGDWAMTGAMVGTIHLDANGMEGATELLSGSGSYSACGQTGAPIQVSGHFVPSSGDASLDLVPEVGDTIFFQ